MSESIKKELTKDNIVNATQINKRDATELKQASKERRLRSKEQSKAEILGNNNINYQKHMTWVND
ncbi:hypothetical protein [Leuconostoc pseudomesenteroides]|uniref:hypothetical protein n=1 Tax=Leuconostoc pseudomesenteroides TaxID=33968 RepID=UPI0039EB4D84